MNARNLCFMVLSCLAMLLPPAVRAAPDPVVLSFAFVGCNRLDGNGVKSTGIKSSANEAQLLRTFKDVAALRPAPQLLILAGDVVKAKKPGTKVLGKQLEAWRKLVQGRLPSSTQLVAFTGNHELLMDAPDGSDTEVPNPPAYAYWSGAMQAFGAGSDGPPAGGDDGLLNDESRLSYTFRSGGTLFIVLDTDSQIDATTIGNVPLNWLAAKLAAAQQDGSVQHVFVMGHKPIVAPDKAADSGASNIRSAQGPAFYQLLNRGGPGTAPTKVRAYLAAHAHLWHYSSQLPLGSGSGTVPQIIAGNGGSPPETGWAASGNAFGYTLVSVTAAGRVTAQAYGRPIPSPYSLQDKAAKARPSGDLLVLKP